MKYSTTFFKTFAIILLVLCTALPTMAGKAVEKQSSKAVLQGTVNINTADAAQLVLLPGIGPKAAESIIAYRSTAGSFTSVGDLVKVKGVGPKTLEKLKPYLSLKGETTLKKIKKS